MRSWQVDGGAEVTQQSLHCTYSTCLKCEAIPFLYSLADVQHFDHGDCCYRDTRTPSERHQDKPPAVPPTLVQKASTALQEQHCCTQKHGAKAQGCKCQQKETVLGELLLAPLQEPEPPCVSCPETPQLVHKYLWRAMPGHCTEQVT